jgi:hypothetical protein
MFNDFVDEIQFAKETKNHLSYYIYLARNCNRVAIWREGGTKEAYIKRRNAYMQVARRIKGLE